MTTKKFQVRFSNSAIGSEADSLQRLRDVLFPLLERYGPNLPTIQLESDHFQVRGLVRAGTVWQGSFARLRDDAPLIVDNHDNEHLIEMEDGDRILDKCFFLYREGVDVLVYQFCQTVGGLTRFSNYWSRLLDTYVELAVAVDTEKLDELLEHGIYEVDFTYARPPVAADLPPSWNQKAFDLLKSVHGAQGSFVLRAPRNGALGGSVRNMIRWLAAGGEVKRAKIRLTDEKDPVDLFMSPVKDKISVPMAGRYPDQRATFEQLEEAYDRQAHRIPQQRRHPRK